MQATRFYVAVLLLGFVPFIGSREARAQAPEASTESRAIQLPSGVGAGEGKEVAVLLDEDHLKLATVTLRGGTALPPHSTSSPATIQVLAGEGVVHVGGEAVPVAEGTVLSLAAGEEHDVVPAAGSDMLLLVHYLRGERCGASEPSP